MSSLRQVSARRQSITSSNATVGSSFLCSDLFNTLGSSVFRARTSFKKLFLCNDADGGEISLFVMCKM